MPKTTLCQYHLMAMELNNSCLHPILDAHDRASASAHKHANQQARGSKSAHLTLAHTPPHALAHANRRLASEPGQ